MTRIVRTTQIDATLTHTYSVAEDYPLFVDSYKRKKIVYRDGKKSLVRMTNLFFLLPLSWEGKGLRKKNEAIYWLQTKGLLKGLRATWTFEKCGRGRTEVRIVGRISGKGISGYILGFIAPLLISSATKKILRSLKDSAETTS